MSDKKRRNLIIVLCILAVIVAIVAIAFAPYGKKATGNSDSPEISETESTTTTSSTLQETVTEIAESTDSIASSTETTFVIPSSTDPIINPNKNYTIFIDKTKFMSFEEDNGLTTIIAKENNNVVMTITPVRDKSYKQCCREAQNEHKKLSVSAQLLIENQNTVYRSQTGDDDNDIITTVYCVDDNKGGCVVIECKAPVSATEFSEAFEIMLSMFKIL